MTRAALWLIRAYQRVLSPLKGVPTCRFYPSCSAYAAEAFERRGFFVGLLKTSWRLCRCHPLTRGGYDPVEPDRALEGSAASAGSRNA